MITHSPRKPRSPVTPRAPKAPPEPTPGDNGTGRGRKLTRDRARDRFPGNPKEKTKKSKREMAGRKETGRKRKGEEEKEAKKENMHPWSSTRGLKHLHRAFPNSLSNLKLVL